MSKLADTHNEFGTPVTMFRCESCDGVFTVCPAVSDVDFGQWTGCLAETCASYDPTRDADKLFEDGKVFRVGDRSHIRIASVGAGSRGNLK